MKVLRFGAGVLFLPVCWVLIRVVWDLLQILQPGDGSILPASGWALAGGFLCWVFLYLTLPRPMRTYVLGHELTHALWGWLMGAQVSRLNVSRERGSVTLSKTNPLIVLAPYFFPFYTFLVIVLFGVLALFYAVEKYALFWLGLVGFT